MLKQDLSNAQDLKAKLAAIMSGHGESNAVQGWSPEPEDDSFENDTSALADEVLPEPDQTSPGKGTTQYWQIASRQDPLRTSKSAFDQGLSHVRKSLPATRGLDQPRPVRRTLSSVSPNKNAPPTIQRQSKAVSEGIEFEKETNVRGVSFRPDDSFNILSFDENDDLLTSTEPQRNIEERGEGESMMTATEL